MSYEKEQALLQKYMDEVMQELAEEDGSAQSVENEIGSESDDDSNVGNVEASDCETDNNQSADNFDEDAAENLEENGNDADAADELEENATSSSDDGSNQLIPRGRPTIADKYFLGKDQKTRWMKTVPTVNVRTRRHNIVLHLPGPKGAAARVKSEMECWSCFFTEDMLRILVHCTNIQIRKQKGKYKEPSRTRETDQSELKAVIGLLYLAGIYKAHRLNLDDLWQTDGTGVEIFNATMSLQRFRFLLVCLRFDDVNTRNERRELDKFAAIRDLFELFVQNCSNNYIPSEYSTIDEMLPAFRGRCPFRQYLPNKPSKYGIKIFAMADSKTFYVTNMEVYLGKQPNGPYELDNSPSEVVKRLVAPIAGTGRNVTMDNWFTSYGLAIDLCDRKLTMIGTVRKNKRELPPQFVETKKRAEGSSLFGFQEKITAVSFVPKKGRTVILFSTMHHDAAIDGESGKPEIITDYNSTKCGVDTVDQLCASYDTARNSRRWPLTIFFSLLNIAGINSRVIYTMNNQKTVIRRVFLKQIASDLIAEHLAQRQANLHLPRHIRQKIAGIKKSREDIGPPKRPRLERQQRCSECPRVKDRKTKYSCRECHKSLCLDHAVIMCSTCCIEETESE